MEQDRPEAGAARERQAAMVEELRKAELVRDRLESLQQLVSSYPQGQHTRECSLRTCTSTGRSERWKSTLEPFGTPSSTLVVPESRRPSHNTVGRSPTAGELPRTASRHLGEYGKAGLPKDPAREARLLEPGDPDRQTPPTGCSTSSRPG